MQEPALLGTVYEQRTPPGRGNHSLEACVRKRAVPYYQYIIQYIMPYGLGKFWRFAVTVWEVNPARKSDEQIAREGLSCMEDWMKELGLAMNLHELGVTEEMLQGIANGTLIMEGGYKVLNHDEVLNILKNSL